MSVDRQWWQGCLIYQIYPRSFRDCNGDGTGDLAGVTEKLDYVAALGVDAIWLSPFYASPMEDFGYDVSDYRQVDPLFGTLEDFSEMVARAHALGLRVIVDQVLNHTSIHHRWFVESRRSRDNPFADWYVWADPRPDGTPPNNWLAVFGGSAWTWDARREQYYLHNFLPSQPDLNFHNPAVQDQLLSDVEYWLGLGVDGVRLDVCNFYFHDPQLRDNPPAPRTERVNKAVHRSNPYAWQRHIYNVSRPEALEFHRRLRAMFDRYPGMVAMGEISADDALATMAEYLAGEDKLSMAYSFDLLTTDFRHEDLVEITRAAERGFSGGWPCWTACNHDVPRTMSRLPQPHHPRQAAIVLAFMGSLRGSICLYQGEELMLTEAEVPFARLQDPYGVPFWPEFKGRDGCRTPIPWQHDAPYCGFSEVEPWLPIPAEHVSLARDLQEQDPDSALHRYRRFIHWRQAQPALRRGRMRLLDAGPGPGLLLERWTAEQRMLAGINVSPEPVVLPIPADLRVARRLAGHGFDGAVSQDAAELHLRGWDACFVEVVRVAPEPGG